MPGVCHIAGIWSFAIKRALCSLVLITPKLLPELFWPIAICKSTGILSHLFDKKKLREKKKWIKEITSGNLIGDATKQAVEAVQAAVMVAVIMPAVAVTATS